MLTLIACLFIVGILLIYGISVLLSVLHIPMLALILGIVVYRKRYYLYSLYNAVKNRNDQQEQD